MATVRRGRWRIAICPACGYPRLGVAYARPAVKPLQPLPLI